MEHPITPPPELVQKLRNEAPQGIRDAGVTRELCLIAAAYRAGADQELDACCEWLDFYSATSTARGLRAARRPKPLSEADQALADLDALVDDLSNHGMGFKATNLRRALERLKELEACCEWTQSYAECGDSLRAARRPKPLSEADQALEALDRIDQLPTAEDQRIIRRALERLKEMEGQGND